MSLHDTMLRIAGVVEESIVDGPGLRYVIFTQGCPHHCPGCHNPETHAFDGGSEVSLASLLEGICKNPLLRGVTFSGGEPFAQSAQLLPLAEALRARRYHLLAYTGHLFETLLANQEHKALLEQLDVLIDGPFMQAKKTLLLPFRGSRNQRIIDVPASLERDQTILHALH